MHSSGQFPRTRLRRLRQNPTLRNLVRETNLEVNKLIQPIFIKHGSGLKSPISSMPGQFQLSIDQLADEMLTIKAAGINAVMLFGIPAVKDAEGSDAFHDQGIIQTAIPVIRACAPEILIISDICCCEYTDHGHCGVIDEQRGDVANDRTLALLAKQAVSHARAGTDVIAPSGNIDGMVFVIRQALDDAGFSHIPILSYAVKYASAMYGPFRQAAEGAPKFGDRRTYQMDCANSREAMRECVLDINEGADMLMVKPAHTYLDVIYRVRETFPHIPLCAYHTSGEYAMLKAASANNWLNERQSVLEVLTAIHRAGADFIITYYAKEVAQWLQS
jgi:porphobilinogen synthase